MRRPWNRSSVVARGLAAGLALAALGCSSRRAQPLHTHLHEYRHGYYNPVDGYFHDDHWHYQGPYTRAYQGPYPSRERAVSYWHRGLQPRDYRAVDYRY